jgi:TetR/AcrR family transcriptional repressor of nem operon
MRYEKGHKEATRQHIIEVAARRFRENGVAGAGLAGVMSDAGLTNGAFYSHFESKDALVRESIMYAVDKRMSQLQIAIEKNLTLEQTIRDYLSPRHREEAGKGCPTAALVAEIARQPKETRDEYSGKVESHLKLLASRLPNGSNEKRRRVALALHAMMIGTLQLARAVSNKKLSDEILQSGVKSALEFVSLSSD